MSPRALVVAALLGAAAVPAIAQAPADLTATVARVLPTVVHISVQRAPKPPTKPEAFADREFFESFLRRQSPPAGQRAAGSGIVIGADGYLLTAAYLFEPEDSVTVRLGDGRTLAATIVGRDRRSGVALLKIPAAGLAVAVAGDPKKLRLAEHVFALGTVFASKSASVTDGIVSALEVEEGELTGYLQTTATLYPGMGGGPLFNLKGELVGMNAMLYTRASGNPLSFAIPIDDAMAVAKELRTSGRVRRGTLGITIQEVTPQIAAAYGMDAPAGALIATISPGSAAERAGIQKGDIIMRFRGEAMRAQAQLVRAIGKSKPGERVLIGVRRMKDVREEDVSVTLDEAPD